MSGMQGGAPPQNTATPPSAPAQPPAASGGLENLMRAGQSLAAQMQMTNPDLVDQLRNQFQGGLSGNNEQSDTTQPDNSSS